MVYAGETTGATCCPAEAVGDDDFRLGRRWARPMSWKKTGLAVAVEVGAGNPRLWVVPPGKGRGPYVPHLSDLTQPWELVRPEDVLSERN